MIRSSGCLVLIISLYAAEWRTTATNRPPASLPQPVREMTLSDGYLTAGFAESGTSGIPVVHLESGPEPADTEWQAGTFFRAPAEGLLFANGSFVPGLPPLPINRTSGLEIRQQGFPAVHLNAIRKYDTNMSEYGMMAGYAGRWWVLAGSARNALLWSSAGFRFRGYRLGMENTDSAWTGNLRKDAVRWKLFVSVYARRRLPDTSPILWQKEPYSAYASVQADDMSVRGAYGSSSEFIAFSKGTTLQADFRYRNQNTFSGRESVSHTGLLWMPGKEISPIMGGVWHLLPSGIAAQAGLLLRGEGSLRILFSSGIARAEGALAWFEPAAADSALPYILDLEAGDRRWNAVSVAGGMDVFPFRAEWQLASVISGERTDTVFRITGSALY